MSSTVCYALLGVAKTPLLLILFRALSGLAGATQPIAQTMVMDLVSDETERSRYLAICNAMFGLAAILGPLCGSLSKVVSIPNIFFIIAGLCGCTTIWGYCHLSETRDLQRTTKEKENEPSSAAGSSGTWGFIVFGSCLSLLCMTLTVQNMSTMEVFAGPAIWGIGPPELGGMIALFGVIVVLLEVCMMKKILKRFSESSTVICASFVLCVSSTCACVSHNFAVHMVFWICSCAAFGIVKTPLALIVGKFVCEESRGAAMGLLAAQTSLGITFGPVLAGVSVQSPSLASTLGFSYLPYVIGGGVALVSGLAMLGVQHVQKRVSAAAPSLQKPEIAAKMNVTAEV